MKEAVDTNSLIHMPTTVKQSNLFGVSYCTTSKLQPPLLMYVNKHTMLAQV
jgi:hypothetical protein